MKTKTIKRLEKEVKEAGKATAYAASDATSAVSYAAAYVKLQAAQKALAEAKVEK